VWLEQRHLSWLEPQERSTQEFIDDFPFLIFDVASALSRHAHYELAIRYLEILRASSDQPDPNMLLELGKCYLVGGDNASAEECFLTAIDLDEDCIEPRIELANMYEKAQEDEEALILAAEAMALQESSRGPAVDGPDGEERPPLSPNSARRAARRNRRKIGKPTVEKIRKTVLPRRYRPKRMGNPDKRRQDEQAHAIRLSQQYQAIVALRQQIRDGREDLVDEWMQSSRELIDDFRSLKKFYSWDKYLHFLGSKSSLQPQAAGQPESELGQMYERLTRSKSALLSQPCLAYNRVEGEVMLILLQSQARPIRASSQVEISKDNSTTLTKAYPLTSG
jgi:general transcription factor 3C polypeptide 3 (transcription factor C subunit 4)